MQKEITLRGERVEYTLERKRVKNINLRIRPDGSIYVSAARGVPQPAIDRLILSNADYILEHRRRAGERMEKLRDCAEGRRKRGAVCRRRGDHHTEGAGECRAAAENA